MSNDPFSNPAEPTGGDKLPLGELLGSLLLVTVHELVKDIDTEYGKTDAIRADIAALDGDNKGTVYADTLVFPRVMRSQLNGSIGGMVLGRLEQGDKKPGKNPPWRLADPTEADREIGRKYLAHVAATAPAEEQPF